MSSLFFQIASLLYIILIAWTYFSKKKFDSLENRAYTVLIIITIITLLVDMASVYYALFNAESFFAEFLCKLYLVCIVAWVLNFTYYVFVISRNDNGAHLAIEDNPKFPFFRKAFYITFGTFGFFTILIFLFNLFIFSDGKKMYTYGPSATISYVLAAICIVFWAICISSSKDRFKDKRFLPVFVFVFLATIAVYIQSTYPEVLLVTSAASFITVLTYFTIENPDMKLINELNIAKDSAEKANNAKSEFLSSMSHEIRTPLNAIVGFSQALNEENLEPEAKEQVSDIMMASETLLELVNGILDISKIEANKLEIMDTEYSFSKIINELNILVNTRLGEKPIEYRVNIDSTIPDVLYGDQIRMKQVILNLLTNAVKYTNEGFIEFRVSSIKKDDICRLIISVEDSGMGIKSDKIDKLFTKFERLDVEKNTTVEGTGLGLAITKKLVELMNGKIICQSVYGKGSKFTIAIDQRIVEGKNAVDEAEVVEDKTDDVELLNDEVKSILVVDDNKLNIKVATVLLKKYDVTIDSCLSGFECIEKIKSGNKYDLILMDDMMPQMSGVETLPKLKEIEGFSTPVCVLTANAISGMREKYLSVGFNDYLAKPIEKVELEKIIKKYINK